MTETEASGLPGRIAELWVKFQPAMMARVETLEAAVVDLLEGGLDGSQRRAAEREAHKLAGSAGTFGFGEASRYARSIERTLEGSDPIALEDALRLSQWVVSLRTALARAPTAPSPRDGGPGLLLVSQDDDLVERVTLEASARGFEVRHARQAHGAAAGLPAGSTEAVVLDADSAGEDPLGALRRWGGAGIGQIIVLASDDSFARRVDAARAGGTAFVRKPISPVELVDVLERVLRRDQATGATVLVVDDDPTVLELTRTLLEGRGMRVRAIDDPQNFGEELERALPDLMVLDVDMPGLNGLDLCRTVRADPRWSRVPILILTGRMDSTTMREAFAAGADDYVSKPVVGPELVGRIESRLARGAAIGGIDTQGPAGLPERRASHALLLRLLQLARRADCDLVIVRVALLETERVRERLGRRGLVEAQERVAALLEGIVAPGDAIGWWGEGEPVLGLFAGNRDRAIAELEEARAELARELVQTDTGALQLDFAAGLAAFPEDGDDLETLLVAADGALDRARTHDGARIVGDPGAAFGVQVVDVVVVEDDPVLAELLQHALAVQGFSTRWIANGDDAVAALAGAGATLRARIILLDVDLPGRDGLSVLRELARSRVTTRSRVLMLTVRSTEREVLTALEAGATDHIAKPFSVPILLRRLRALLAEG